MDETELFYNKITENSALKQMFDSSTNEIEEENASMIEEIFGIL